MKQISGYQKTLQNRNRRVGFSTVIYSKLCRLQGKWWWKHQIVTRERHGIMANSKHKQQDQLSTQIQYAYMSSEFVCLSIKQPHFYWIQALTVCTCADKGPVSVYLSFHFVHLCERVCEYLKRKEDSNQERGSVQMLPKMHQV